MLDIIVLEEQLHQLLTTFPNTVVFVLREDIVLKDPRAHWLALPELGVTLKVQSMTAFVNLALLVTTVWEVAAMSQQESAKQDFIASVEQVTELNLLLVQDIILALELLKRFRAIRALTLQFLSRRNAYFVAQDIIARHLEAQPKLPALLAITVRRERSVPNRVLPELTVLSLIWLIWPPALCVTPAIIVPLPAPPLIQDKLMQDIFAKLAAHLPLLQHLMPVVLVRQVIIVLGIL